MFVTLEPLKQEVAVVPGELLLDVINKEKLNVPFLCSGKGLCATCHVYIARGSESVSPKTGQERTTLTSMVGSRPDSRLACQTRVFGPGVVVEVPEGMYVGSLAEIEALIGRRAGISILHPKTGEVLIEKGKLVLRSTLEHLAAEHFSFSDLVKKIN